MQNVVVVERLFLGAMLCVAGGILLGFGFRKTGILLIVAGVILCWKDFVRQRRFIKLRREESNRAQSNIVALTEQWNRNAGLDRSQIKGKIHGIPATSDYWLFLKSSNGAQRALDGTTIIELWPFERLAKENGDWKERMISIPGRTYGLYFFGANNRGFKYAFRVNEWRPSVVTVDAGGQIVKQANSFVQFLEGLST